MGIRLYDSAWVILRGSDTPEQVRKDQINPATFHVAGFRYDIDGRAFEHSTTIPDIVQMLSIAEARNLGLSTQYMAPKSIHV